MCNLEMWGRVFEFLENFCGADFQCTATVRLLDKYPYECGPAFNPLKKNVQGGNIYFMQITSNLHVKGKKPNSYTVEVLY